MMNVKIKIFLTIIILLFPKFFCQLKVYPDHYVPSDSPYSYLDSLYLTADIKNRQIYKLGYFTQSNNPIVSYKYGLIYYPDKSCSGGQISSSGTFFISNIIKDKESTQGDNFSEELELLQNICNGNNLIINTPFPTLHNTGYILRYKLLIGCDNESNKPNIEIYLKILANEELICSFSMDNIAEWFFMTIQSTLSQTNKITMNFYCHKSEESKSFIVNTNDELKFIIKEKTNKYIYLSFYQVVLEDSTDSYLSNINDKKIIRTYNGLEKCNDIAEENNKCLLGYTCQDNNQCKSCDFTCESCSGTSQTQCKGCTPLTFPDKSIGQSTCNINNIDITNFKDLEISVPLGYNEFHERSSLGLWIFISDLAKARNGNFNIYHVVLKDRYVLSIIPNEISVDIYCHAYEDLYRKITSETTLQSNYADRNSDFVLNRLIPSTEQLQYINGKDLSGQWFHASCGLSFDHKKFYASTMINGKASTIERALKHENLYYDSAKSQYVENDIFNRHIITEIDKYLNLQIKNFGNAGTKIFLKYLLLFQEYIPPSYKYMYYDYYKENGIEEILLQIPFDFLDINTNAYYIKMKYYDDTIKDYYELNPIVNKAIDLTAPINLKSLVLPQANHIYKNINCKIKDEEFKSLSLGGLEKINWDDNKPLFCQNYLDTQHDLCLNGIPCVINSNKYIMYPGWSMGSTRGYCDNLCSGPMTCTNALDPSNYCTTTDSSANSIYNLFYSCENKETKYYLQFSSFYNSQDIVIGVGKLNSYIIEIWYYPDFFLSDSSRQGKYYYPETYKNIVLLTNIFHAYFLHSEYKTLKVEDDYSTHTTPHYHPYEWNKLVFRGLYKDYIYYKYFYINNLINEPIEFKHIRDGEDGILEYIKFSASTYDIDGVYNQWATGYYRGLRIWRGDQANVPLSILYDNYYSNEICRITSIVGYFPLTNEYIKDNLITEILGTPFEVQEGNKKLRRYNFSSKFDFIRSQYPSLGYYLLADSTAPKASQCGTGCLRCWNGGKNCYECAEGYLLNIYRACEPVSKYYFKSPSISSSTGCEFIDAELIVPNSVWKSDISPITVTFWIKIIGFGGSTTTSLDIVKYSDTVFLRFAENDIGTGIKRGLSLINNYANGNLLVANDPDFRERIGYWTFISLSYYKKDDWHPQMINFEIDGINFPLLTPLKDINELSFDKFTIKKELYALMFNVKYYHEYILGAYGFVANDGNLITPFAIPMAYYSYLVPGNSPSNCFDSRDFKDGTGSKFGCGGDKDILFDSFATTFNEYIELVNGYAQPKECEFKNDYENSESLCLNACKGVEKLSCSCLNRNYNSQILIKTSEDIIYCRTLDFINFANAKPITINHVRTAKETKKFTMQFWMYFYNYVKGNFKGATFLWKGHNEIRIYKDENNKYFVECTIFTKEKDWKQFDQLNDDRWNFISCSVNFEEGLIYLDINNDIDDTEGTDNSLNGKRLKYLSFSPRDPTDFLVNNDYTTLQIKDNSDIDDWGYLYYRQIHLWKYAYFNAEFLSRVNLLTPAKFPYLLNSWETYYKGYKDGDFFKNVIIKDICEIAQDFNVTYTGQRGFNYVEESKYIKDRFFDICSEDGEYYDINLKQCLPFADLGLIDDFTFTDVPFSYSGSYSMALWIFFEESSTMGSGIHLKWERHLQITIIKETQLLGYCLPQGYYSDDISNYPFSDKVARLPNYYSTPLLKDDESESGNWIFVLCSVSNYGQTYFIKGNRAEKSDITLISEDLYQSDVETTPEEYRISKSVYPYRYFMSEVKDGTPQTSKLVLEGLANDKRIYIRNLFLFKDYIPDWYAEQLKNTDLSVIEADKMLQSMVFVCNFAHFNLEKMTLTYYVINQIEGGDKSRFTKTKKTVKLYRSSKISPSKTFELCSNFGFVDIRRPEVGNLCRDITIVEDSRPFTDFYYCNYNRIPIVCMEKRYITREINKINCTEKCLDEKYIMRIPGTPSYSGIFNLPLERHVKLDGDASYTNFLDYCSKKSLLCDSNFLQVGYNCHDPEIDPIKNTNRDKKSAFFFSRCYNQPNFYGEISNESKELLPNGYFFEFWFKLDKVQVLQHCGTSASEEYILFSTPHSIYLNLKENKYYYKIIDSIYSSTLDGINEYEWNKIIIKTTLGLTLGQNVYVYINFDIDNIKATILNIPSSIKMQLQYISFCSKEDNGDCTPAGAMDVTWGSAYYRNIRVWELLSSSIYSIQDFNIEIYTEWPLSLKLFYPLIASKINYNLLEEVVDGKDSILVQHEESYDFNSLDKWGFYNYAINFDWGEERSENMGRFISSMDGIQITSQECSQNCARCYSKATTNCYQCSDGYVLKGMTCIVTNGYRYLKVPSANKKKVSLEIDETPGFLGHIRSYAGITIHFYMKFEGVIQNPVEIPPRVVELSPSTYISYNIITAYLEFLIEGQTAFRYTTFYDLLGQWIPYSIAIYVGENPIPERYPHMFTFSVNKNDIPFVSNFVLPDTLNRIRYLYLGNEVIALFADLRIYNTFIQGSFGHAISNDKDTGIILRYSFRGTGNDCLTEDQKSDKSVEPICVPDYIDYLAKSCGRDLTKYFDLSIPGEEPCASCDEYCVTKCFNPANTQCNCDMTHGLFWLRRDKRTRVTYCQYVTSTDYSILKDVVFNVPVSKNFESTIEFWLFIYSYNSETFKFQSMTIEWNLHNKIKIENKGNAIVVLCYPFVDTIKETHYSEYIQQVIAGYSWLYIRCGTDYISRTHKFFLNAQESDLLTDQFPERENYNLTTLKIIPDQVAPTSFGFVFLREIKLWQQYNFKYINTQYMNLYDDVGLYNEQILKSEGIYPGLITYITSEFEQSEYENVMNFDYKYKLVNKVGKDELAYKYNKTYYFKRNMDDIKGFLGYNIIDPDNYGYYEDLILCKEGYVFNSENQVCLEVSLTKCRFPGDVSDNCISCPDENKYIYPPNGNCVSECGPRFYPRDDMNQCRDCHYTCYTCFGYAYNNCSSCIDDRYLVESLHECVLYCQNYSLVASKLVPNLCVPFDVNVSLVNYQEHVPIDINTFDYLIAEVTYINTKTYYTKWRFDPAKTRAYNPGRQLNFDDNQVPFEPNTKENLENLNVSLNHSFFELRTFYVFTLDITSYNLLNVSLIVTRSFDFNLTMNSYPVDGHLEIIPSVGLHNTTTFLMRCQNWTDDTIKNETDLTYQFFAKEDLSDELIMLQNWSTNNEIISNFALEKDALPSNNITIICKVRDNYLAETERKMSIRVVTDLNSGLYLLENAIKDYYLPDKQLSPVELYHLSEVLKSYGIDLYKPLRPSHYQTIYMPSIDKDLVVKQEPECVTFNKECNNRGECTINVDEFLVCRCEEGYVGTNCHIDKNGGDKLLKLYNELYTKLLGTMQTDITYYEFKVMHNLFQGAKYFSQDISFFKNQMETFINMAINVYPKSIDNNTYEYIDLLDYYYSYELYRLNTKRVTKMYETGLPYRDLPINDEDKDEFKEAFEYIHNQLLSLIHYKCNMHINTQINYSYSSDNFYIAVKSVNPTFEENEFFEERKGDYRTFPRFMTCLNYIENTKLNNPYFQTFMIYIEYLNFPFGYDDEIYKINTSPLIELRFLDATTGKIFDLTDCTGPNYINIDMPFTNYRWLDQLNKQKLLYDPRNYKAPDDPIFSDPIYINKSGYVSDDTVEERIKRYHREYNFSCRYYDIEEFKFDDTGVIFTNFTSDTNFIEFNTSHLSRFTTFFVPNNATFKVKGRFFYVPRTELMKWKGNYNGNFGLIVFIILISVYIVFSLVLGCYDSIYFVQETLLESLKKEIVKVFLPYRNRKEKEKEALKIIPLELDPNLITEKKFGDKVKENNRYGKNKGDDNEEKVDNEKEKGDYGLNANNRTTVTSSDRLISSRNIKNKSREYLTRKKNPDQNPKDNVMTTGNRPDLNLDLEMQNFYRTNIGQKELAELNPNRLPEAFENRETEYKRRLNGYANLSLSFCQFLGKNFLQRNLFINPFFNISMFAPRWKKLIVFTTEIAIEMLLLAVFLTNDETALDSDIVSLIKYSAFTALITDTFMHFFTIFFQVSNRQKRRLLKLVLMKGQLIVLKEYEDMQCVNTFITIIGLLISLAIWAFSFYMSFTFYSVWKVQNKAFIYSFIITVAIDFLVLEFIYELFLALIYMKRKSSGLFRRVGEFLDRIRNHRCMS